MLFTLTHISNIVIILAKKNFLHFVLYWLILAHRVMPKNVSLGKMHLVSIKLQRIYPIYFQESQKNNLSLSRGKVVSLSKHLSPHNLNCQLSEVICFKSFLSVSGFMSRRRNPTTVIWKTSKDLVQSDISRISKCLFNMKKNTDSVDHVRNPKRKSSVALDLHYGSAWHLSPSQGVLTQPIKRQLRPPRINVNQLLNVM